MNASTLPPSPLLASSDTLSTHEAAQLLGLAVRSVQLMVDRGDLQAWKTPGGHRRIARASVQAWLAGQARALAAPLGSPVAPTAATPLHPAPQPARHPRRVLLIEDSAHAVNLVKLLMQQHFPEVELHVADNGVAGLITAGQMEPCVLVIDIRLPGIDGATLVSGLRSHPDFAQRDIIILTGLNEAERMPYAFALHGLPIVEKTQMVLELPRHLRAALDRCALSPALR